MGEGTEYQQPTLSFLCNVPGHQLQLLAIILCPYTVSALPLLNGFWRLFSHKHESSNKYTIIILKWKETTAAHQQLKHSRKRPAVVEKKDSKCICEDRERHGACHYTRVNAGRSTSVVFDQLLFSVAAQVKAIQPKLGSNFAKPHIRDVGTYSTFPILYINRLSLTSH